MKTGRERLLQRILEAAFVLIDDPSAGNILGYDNDIVDQTPQSGDTLVVSTGDYTTAIN